MLTSRSLEHLLTAWPGGPSGPRRGRAEPDLLLAAARAHRLLPTLVSAWTREGVMVAPHLLAATDAQRARAERYRDVESLLAVRASAQPTVLKGRWIAERYPTGWLRATTDLDLEVAQLDDVVRLALTLEHAGWTLTGVTLFHRADDVHAGVDAADLRRTGQPSGPDLVQIQSFALLGDGSAPPVPRCPRLAMLRPIQRSLVELIGAVHRRGAVLGRDVLDLRVLVTGCEPGTSPHPLPDLVDGLGLAAAWHALRRAGRRVWPKLSAGTALRVAADGPVERRPSPRTAAAAWCAGYPVTGVPQPGSDRTTRFSVVLDAAGGATFAGPLGSGALRPLTPPDLRQAP